MTHTELELADLYTADETAWLEAMADLVRHGAYSELDYPNLLEYLSDMAKRDRREVESRLAVLIAHVLKWLYQPDHRSRSWRLTIVEQRQELADLAARGVLRSHAEAMLGSVYHKAVERVVAEIDLNPATFPAECPFSLDELIAYDPV
ncbi:MAG: DUF29 domain-containing protein [Gemmataceae bacterium]